MGDGDHVSRRIWNEGAEVAPLPRIAELQAQLIGERITKAYREAPLYRELWSARGLTPEAYSNPEDLARFPFVNKEDVRRFRERTGDLFGGVAGPIRPGSRVSQSTGTSGAPTLFVTSAADEDGAAEEVASYLWGAGLRPGEAYLSPVGEPGATVTRFSAADGAFKLIGATLVPAQATNIRGLTEQIEMFRPTVVGVFQSMVDGLRSHAMDVGLDLGVLSRSIKSLVFAGTHLTRGERRRLEAEFGAQVFEIGGLGDIGMWAAECDVHDGFHVRPDYFAIEVINPETGKEVPVDGRGEIVYTSLWEESMNYVRWRSDDLGFVNREPCACGRTSPRLTILGRVWERSVANGITILPQEIGEVLAQRFASTIYFQIVRRVDSREVQSLRVALPAGASVADVAECVAGTMGAELAIDAVSEEQILAGQPVYKYRQILDLAA
jgi:phenylacetate-CoA ligase